MPVMGLSGSEGGVVLTGRFHPVTGMLLPPGLHSVHVGSPTEKVPVLRTAAPLTLIGLLACVLATRLRTPSLVIVVTRISNEQLLAAQTSAATALDLHVMRHRLPHWAHQRKKTRKKTDARKSGSTKKQEQLEAKCSKKTDQEDGTLSASQLWRLFRRPPALCWCQRFVVV